MLGDETLDQRHRLTQHGAVALHDALHIVVHAELRTTLAVLHVGVDDGRLFHARIHLKTCILVVILRVVLMLVDGSEWLCHCFYFES